MNSQPTGYLPPSPPSAPVSDSTSQYSMSTPSSNTYTIIIVVLVILLVLGINIVYFSESVVIVVWRFITNIFSILGYSIGSGIDITATATKDAAKTGIDILGSAVSDVGILMKQETQQKTINAINNIDNTINNAKAAIVAPAIVIEPSPAEISIQNPIAIAKHNWCLIGESAGTRSCAAVGKEDRCMSGQIYPDQHSCINPNFSPNM